MLLDREEGANGARKGFPWEWEGGAMGLVKACYGIWGGGRRVGCFGAKVKRDCRVGKDLGWVNVGMRVLWDG